MTDPRDTTAYPLPALAILAEGYRSAFYSTLAPSPERTRQGWARRVQIEREALKALGLDPSQEWAFVWGDNIVQRPQGYALRHDVAEILAEQSQ